MAIQNRTSWQFQHGIQLPLLFIAYVSTPAMLPSSIPNGCESVRVKRCENFKRKTMRQKCREETSQVRSRTKLLRRAGSQ